MILTVVLSSLGFAVSSCLEGEASCTYQGVDKGLCAKLGDCIPCVDSTTWVSNYNNCDGYVEGQDSHAYCTSADDRGDGLFPYQACPRGCRMCSYEAVLRAGECAAGFTKLYKLSGSDSVADARFGISKAESQCFTGCSDDQYLRRKMDYLGGVSNRYNEADFGCESFGFDQYHEPAASVLVAEMNTGAGEVGVFKLKVENGHVWGRYTAPPSSAPDTLSPTMADVDDGSIDVTFEFGTGCEAGSGTFEKYMGIENAQNDIGIIPKGTRNVKITLQLGREDLDIRLFDTTAASDFYTEGKALIAWCEEKPGEECNYGIRELVPLGGGPGETVYTAPNNESMTIKYSGFAPNPIAPNKGNEFIEIVGEVVADLRMSAFAYETGDVTINYEWDAGETDCCKGTAACTGSFTKFGLKEKDVALVGYIPVGVKDVRIDLESPDNGDLDIRLYDTSRVDEFDKGKAIIAWCGTPDCNKGALGSSIETGHLEETIENYDGTANDYRYSGYNGVPAADGSKRWGTEFVEITGVTERPLMMEVFSYLPGSADLTYSYWIDI